MAGFESLPQAIDPGVALQPILAEDTAFFDEALEDEIALGLVINDVTSAESYLQSKNLILGMEQADDLVRAYVKPRTWQGTDVPRANLGMPVVMEAIEKIMPALYLALFSNKAQPFLIEPTGKTTPEAARARGKVLAWAIKQADFKEQMRRTLKTALTYGFTIGMWGWKEQERKIKKYRVGADGKVEKHVEIISTCIPTYECLDLRQILVDPTCKTHNVRKDAKFVIKQLFITANDLDDLRDNPDYKNVPTRDELRTILAAKQEPTEDSLVASKTNVWRDFQSQPAKETSTADPLKQPLELLEYWSADRVITVLQRKIVIRNVQNEFGEVPTPSCSFIDVLGSFWGFGVAKLLSGEQRFQQGVVNSWIDALALILNPVYQLLKGVGAGTQQISVSPGKVVNENGELKPLVQPSITTEAMAAIENSENRANRRVGANSGSSVPTQALRTAEGVQSFAGDVTQKLQYFLEIFSELVFVPTLEAFIEMCNDHLTPKQINDILSEVDGKAYQGDVMDVYNATTKIDVLASTKLTARQAAAQLIPLISNLVQNSAVQDSLTAQGRKFNFEEFLSEGIELLGWDIDALIVPMSAEEQQRALLMNEAASRATAALQVEQQKHQNDLENINEKGTVQAGVAVVKQAVKAHLDEAMQELSNMQGQGQ